MSPVDAVIGLGGNLGDVRATFSTAIAALASCGEIVARSPVFWSLPLGPPQPLFRNAAVRLRTTLAPAALLARLHAVEAAAGRVRDERWGARPLDLDLLYYGGRVSADTACTLPHPRVRERSFALGPAACVAPELRDPVVDRPLAALAGEREGGIMEELTTKEALRAFRRRTPGRLVFVPTMGALHAGHLSLVEHARGLGDTVLVSIFVNPLQFGPNEDLARYPRDPAGDRRKLLERGVDALFEVETGAMYGPRHETRIVQEKLPHHLCGLSRPGHFPGVLTVVAKLLMLAAPEVLVLGRKDFQQTVILRRMIEDLDFPVELAVAPTVREPDGLALSSRNAYLSAEQRRAARQLSAALFAAESAFAAGGASGEELAGLLERSLSAEPLLAPEYHTVVDPDSLEPRAGPARAGDVALVAAKLGSTRLIDNRVLGAPPDPVAAG